MEARAKLVEPGPNKKQKHTDSGPPSKAKKFKGLLHILETQQQCQQPRQGLQIQKEKIRQSKAKPS